MTNKTIYFTILIISFLSCKSDSKPEKEFLENSKKKIKIDRLGNRYLELNRFSGVILVIEKCNTIYNEKFGSADYEGT